MDFKKYVYSQLEQLRYINMVNSMSDIQFTDTSAVILKRYYSKSKLLGMTIMVHNEDMELYNIALDCDEIDIDELDRMYKATSTIREVDINLMDANEYVLEIRTSNILWVKIFQDMGNKYALIDNKPIYNAHTLSLLRKRYVIDAEDFLVIESLFALYHLF